MIGISWNSLTLLCLVHFSTSSALDVYIIGGQGDLARRYLWKGFFDLFQKYSNESMHFYGTGRREMPIQKSATELSPFHRVLKDSIKCRNDTCEKALLSFISNADYFTLNNVEHYKNMCSRMLSAKGEVIIYFSVPPNAYEKVVKMISSHCASNLTQNKYKFVFEKPFGTDLESAISLSRMVGSYLTESQVYRVDHYLGKETVHQILDFWRRNPEIESMMNNNFVKSIDIVATETIGCKGRASFYEKSGVIRDMLQSHLTEILCLLTMNVDQAEAKLHLLKNISTVRVEDLSFSQYEGYSEEVALETGKSATWVPTFASAQMAIAGSRWQGTPITLASGKMLNERNGYGRILFKEEHVRRKTSFEGCQETTPQIIFVIRHETLNLPAILVSHDLPITSDYAPQGWIEIPDFNNVTIFGASGKCFRIFVPITQQDAYSYLIERLYNGDKDSFVPSKTLLESWRIWSSVVNQVDQTKHIEIYHQGSDLSEVRILARAETAREEL